MHSELRYHFPGAATPRELDEIFHRLLHLFRMQAATYFMTRLMAFF